MMKKTRARERETEKKDHHHISIVNEKKKRWMEEDWPSLKGGVHIHDSYEWIDEKGENCNQ